MHQTYTLDSGALPKQEMGGNLHQNSVGGFNLTSLLILSLSMFSSNPFKIKQWNNSISQTAPNWMTTYIELTAKLNTWFSLLSYWTERVHQLRQSVWANSQIEYLVLFAIILDWKDSSIETISLSKPKAWFSKIPSWYKQCDLMDAVNLASHLPLDKKACGFASNRYNLKYA